VQHASAGVRELGAGQHQRTVADRRHRTPELPELGDLPLQFGRAEVLPHARCVAAGQQQGVVVGGHEVLPGHGAAEGRAGDHPVVGLLRLPLGTEPAEDHPVQQARIGGGHGARALGRDHHLMTGVGQQLPWHCDLGDIEVPVGKGHQHSHADIMQHPQGRQCLIDRRGG
jgi:hypothetical protein